MTGNRILLPKTPTGISGLDEITQGGFPQGRPTLVCGGAGCGKTLLGIEFLVHGAQLFNEPGVFMSFEETAADLSSNVTALGFDLERLKAEKKLLVDHVRIERSEIEVSGEYDLEGLFVRLGHAIQVIGAKRVVLDTLESLFGGLPDPHLLRAELRRLFGWLKEKGVTAVITAERGEHALTRQGLEEYISDCVILLDHRITNQVSTRRLHIVKYRGSTHGTNEYPFLIDEDGMTVLPITSLGLNYPVSTERIPSGIPRLDTMLGGKGYFRNTTVLVSGTAGSGKTSMTSHFVDAACQRGERALFFAFEEAPDQIIRNMRSIGIDLERWVNAGMLQFHATRPTMNGLEMHLSLIHKSVNTFKPAVVVIDPINSFLGNEDLSLVKAMLLRLVDFLKTSQITAFFTSLTSGGASQEHTDVAISSLVDTWLLLRDVESSGERNRVLYVLKSRGMAHSNQIREFLLTDHGVELQNVYIGQGGVLTGSARLAQAAQEHATELARQQEIDLKKLALERKRKALEAQIALLQAEYESEAAEVQRVVAQERDRETRQTQDRVAMGKIRQADPAEREIS